MKPMILKEPAACCGSPTVLWVPEQHVYVCPCGQLRVKMNGVRASDRSGWVRKFFIKRRTN